VSFDVGAPKCDPRADPSHSPTGSATSTSTTRSERQYYQQSSTQPAAAVVHASTVGGYQSPQDYPHSSVPTNTQRQDSAISHQRGTSKEGLIFAPPSDFHFAHSQRVPENSRQSTSPGLATYHLPQSSAPPAQSYMVAPSARSHEHVASLSAPAPSQTGTDPVFSNITQSLPQDHTTRQRYNVRFAAVHTSANMPSTQRSRHSPLSPSAPVSTETIDSPSALPDDIIEPTIEPATQTPTHDLKPSEELSPPDEFARESSVERCPRCSEPWSKPLLESSAWPQQSPAESSKDFAMAADNIIARFKQYGRDTEHKYELWKEKHRHCPPKDRAASSEPLHRRTLNGHIQGNGPPQAASNKRKSEMPHDDNSKLRKVLFDPDPATTHPARPSDPI
jgi:hypothetical protein